MAKVGPSLDLDEAMLCVWYPQAQFLDLFSLCEESFRDLPLEYLWLEVTDFLED